eukprot:s690_g9.t1
MISFRTPTVEVNGSSWSAVLLPAAVQKMWRQKPTRFSARFETYIRGIRNATNPRTSKSEQFEILHRSRLAMRRLKNLAETLRCERYLRATVF